MRKLTLVILIVCSSLFLHAQSKNLVTQEQLYGTWKFSEVIPYGDFVDTNTSPEEREALKNMIMHIKGTQTITKNNLSSIEAIYSITIEKVLLFEIACTLDSELSFSYEKQEIVDKNINIKCAFTDLGVFPKESEADLLKSFHDSIKEQSDTTSKLEFVSKDTIISTDAQTNIGATLHRVK